LNILKKKSAKSLDPSGHSLVYISMKTLRAALASLLIGSISASTMVGCSTAYADRDKVAAPSRNTDPRIAIATAPSKVRAPYDVQILGEDGSSLSTYAQGNRFYVLGNHGTRYTVHVKNPTARRVEAVITVDGLDVIDGENGDLKKRGYIIQPYGELRVEGFRTSTAEVATFRFSTVDGSYAGKKGKARNVGVVAVALFEEEAGAQIAAPIEEEARYESKDKKRYDYRRDLDTPTTSSVPTSGAGGRVTAGEATPAAPAKVDSVSARESSARAPAGDRIMPAPPSDGDGWRGRDIDDEAPVVTTPTAPRTNRPGLGTEFGESRYSPTQFTKFVRSSTKPAAIAELRYNDFGGLRALGIDVEPLPSPAEIDTRETADPFPGDASFARPPR
jgi:hypothetical protein